MNKIKHQEKNLDETKTSNLPYKEFKVMSENSHCWKQNEHGKKISKEIGNIKKKFQTKVIETQNTITKLKNM